MCSSDLVARPDDYSRRLEKYGAHWRSAVDLDHAALAQLVKDDAIDILVDLSGHTANNRLLTFAMKPALIQVNWLGFPSTTGMRAPILGSSTAVDVVAITMIAPTIGRNAKPVLIGEYIRIVCR